MRISPQILEVLHKAYADRRLVICAGMGISEAAGVPSLGGLIEKLADHARASGGDTELIDEAITLAEQGKRIDALSNLKKLLGRNAWAYQVEKLLDDTNCLVSDTERPVPELARAIATLGPGLQAVLTINLDQILEDAFRKQAFGSQWTPFTRVTGDIARRVGFILKLRGTLGDRATWVLTRDQVDQALHDGQRVDVLNALFRTMTVLFVGHDFASDESEEIVRVLERARALDSEQPTRHVALVRSEQITQAWRAQLERAGVRVVALPDGDADDEILTLLRALADQADMARVQPPEHDVEPSPARDAHGPFPGLSFFDEDMADSFFGRDAEIAGALQALGDTGAGHRRWLHIDGPSGAGKSSLVRAGLIPKIRAGEIVGGPKAWRVAVMRPGSDPIQSLAAELHGAFQNVLPESRSLAAITAELDTGERALASFLRQHTPSGFFLCVDQLEEAFTLASRERCQQFDALLAAALTDKDGPLYLLTAVRSDFAPQMAKLPGIEALLNREASRFYLKSMSLPGLRAAVVKPTRRAGLRWDGDLVARILDDAQAVDNIDDHGGVGASLPLVAHTLHALWLKRDGDCLTLHEYARMGGVTGALTQSADAILASLDEDNQTRAMELLLSFVRVGRGPEHTRRVVRRDDALRAAGGGERAEYVLARLSGARDVNKRDARVPRLLVVTSDGEDDRVELVHEALLRDWKTMRKSIEKRRTDLVRREDLRTRYASWKRAGSQRNNLPSGDELVYLSQVCHPNAQEREFLAMAERRWLRWRRWVRALLVALTLGLAGMTCLALYARAQQKEATRQKNFAEERLKLAIDTSYEVLGTLHELETRPDTVDIRKRLLNVASALQDTLLSSAGDSLSALRSRMVSHQKRGDIAMLHDDLEVARKEFEAALKIGRRIAKQKPTSMDAQRNLSIGLNSLGEVEVAAGNLTSARSYFQQSLNTRKALAQADPTNAVAQRDLCASFDLLGDAEVAAGSLTSARSYFQQSLDIAKALAQADPTNAAAQRSLLVGLKKLGEVEVAAGNRTSARSFYQQSLDIAKALAQADPTNAAAQRRLLVGLSKLGEVEVAAGDLTSARSYYQQSLDIAKALAQADPTNAAAQRDLSVGFDLLGQVEVATGNLTSARSSYQQSLSILKALAQVDPTNAVAQRDLSVSLTRLGDMEFEAGNLTSARSYFQQSLDIIKALAQADPTNAVAQRDLSTSLHRLGDMEVAAGSLASARSYFRQSLDIAKALAQADLTNVAVQRILSVSLRKLGEVEFEAGDLTSARSYLQQSLDILKALAQANPTSADMQLHLLLLHAKFLKFAMQSDDDKALRHHVQSGNAIIASLNRGNKFKNHAQFKAVSEFFARVSSTLKE